MKLDFEDHDDDDGSDDPVAADPNVGIDTIGAGVHLILAAVMFLFFVWLAVKLGGPLR